MIYMNQWYRYIEIVSIIDVVLKKKTLCIDRSSWEEVRISIWEVD